jgi:hypothetical protein
MPVWDYVKLAGKVVYFASQFLGPGSWHHWAKLRNQAGLPFKAAHAPLTNEAWTCLHVRTVANKQKNVAYLAHAQNVF